MRKFHVTLLKKDAAFLYAILESLEGMAAYSTVSGSAAGPEECVVRVLVPEGFAGDMEQVFAGLSRRLPMTIQPL